jgi:hypothetical protein
MVERLRAFLREIGPGGVRSGLAILLAALALLILSLAAIRFGLWASGARKPNGIRARPAFKVRVLEDDATLQAAELTAYQPCIQTLADTNAIKMIENHDGVAFVQQIQLVTQSVQVPS